MPADARAAIEAAMKRLQGTQDARSKIGELARGKNMYPGGAQATTGGGPGFGRPPESPQAAQAQAMKERMMANMQQERLGAERGIQGTQQQGAKEQQLMARKTQQQSLPPAGGPAALMQSQLSKKKAAGLAQQSMAAAAKRRMVQKMQRG